MVQKAGPSKPAVRRGLAAKPAAKKAAAPAGGGGKARKSGGGGGGSGGGKPKDEEAAAEEEEDPAAAAAERKRQQALLDVFGDAFGPVLGDGAALAAGLQRVKQALYARDFGAAFGRADHLDVYAARWSPTRALGYARVLAGIRPHLAGLVAATPRTPLPLPPRAAGEAEEGVAEGAPPPPPPPPPRLRMLAIGGGAAEIVALAAFLHEPAPPPGETRKEEEEEEGEEEEGGKGKAGAAEAGAAGPGAAPASWAGDLTLLDAGPWGAVVDKLYARLTRPRPLSAYASAAARAANRALVEPARFRAHFTQRDVLELGPARLAELVGGGGDGDGDGDGAQPPAPLLVTLLFTLNELYTAAGLGRTTGFLRNLARAVAVGSLLLVVDSPGSYSEAAVGKDAQKYPMQWLLDQTLLTAERLPEGACRWEKLESDESVWFRVAEGLRYPIPLENMRYQMHLYRAISPLTVHDD